MVKWIKLNKEMEKNEIIEHVHCYVLFLFFFLFEDNTNDNICVMLGVNEIS